MTGQLSQILRFFTLFQNLDDDPFHSHDKRLFIKTFAEGNMLHLSRPACSAHGRPRAQGQRVMLGRQLVGSMIRPNAAHTVLLLRYFGGKQKSATLRILRKVLPPQLPLKLAAFQDETNLEYKAGMI